MSFYWKYSPAHFLGYQNWKKYLQPGKKEGEKGRKGRRGSLKVREVVVVREKKKKKKTLDFFFWPSYGKRDCRSLPPWSGRWPWMPEAITGHFWGPGCPYFHSFFLRGSVKILIARYIWSHQYLSPGIWKSFSHIYLTLSITVEVFLSLEAGLPPGGFYLLNVDCIFPIVHALTCPPSRFSWWPVFLATQAVALRRWLTVTYICLCNTHIGRVSVGGISWAWHLCIPFTDCENLYGIYVTAAP